MVGFGFGSSRDRFQIYIMSKERREQSTRCPGWSPISRHGDISGVGEEPRRERDPKDNRGDSSSLSPILISRPAVPKTGYPCSETGSHVPSQTLRNPSLGGGAHWVREGSCNTPLVPIRGWNQLRDFRGVRSMELQCHLMTGEYGGSLAA